MEYQSEFMRQYTITCKNDLQSIENGRCPSYAVTWGQSENAVYWPKHHDYFMGNGKDIIDNLELRQILSEKLARGTLPDKLVFCDLDGVLADFEDGVKSCFKKPITEVKPSSLWGFINKSNTFFETLGWMPNGRELWERIRKYDPIILTGIPPGHKTAEEQKRNWCARELGPDVHVITCLSRDKYKYCLLKSILIDDKDLNRENWTNKGGKFILYDEEYLDIIVDRIDRHMCNNTEMTSP